MNNTSLAVSKLQIEIRTNTVETPFMASLFSSTATVNKTRDTIVRLTASVCLSGINKTRNHNSGSSVWLVEAS